MYTGNIFSLAGNVNSLRCAETALCEVHSVTIIRFSDTAIRARQGGQMSVLEKKYSVKEIARIVGCSEQTVRRRFRDDPKVGRYRTWGDPQ